MKIVFICAPYTAPTKHGIWKNIRAADRAARELAANDIGFVCPHNNSRHMDDAADGRFWYQLYLDLLVSCHAVYALPGWQRSGGCQAEIVHAEKHNIPVFERLAELVIWAKGA